MSGENRVPQKRKFRKDRKGNKGRIVGVASRGIRLTHGDYGLKALESYKLTANQIEAMRRSIVKYLKGGTGFNTLFIKAFPDKPISKKPIGTRMGGGKSSVDHWVCIVKPGKILFEIPNISEENARKALSLAASKIPIKTKFITKMESI